jgi:LAS superfamily LD-carboxypeptidase LdcB
MGTAPVIRERRILKGKAGVPTGARSGPPSKRRSARSFRHSGERRRRSRRLAIFLALLFAFGVGYSIVGLAEERTASADGPYAPAATLSKDKTRKTSYPSSTTCDDPGVLVDRSHPLPSDYVPKDLVPLREYGIPTLGSEVLRREAAEHLERLVEDAMEGATEGGEKLVVASAYRSYEGQQRSHGSLMGVLGADAGRLSAEPGHSQHQLGTAVDFTNADAGYKLGVPFARTSASRWLEHHAWEYGFVLAYPRGEEERTGYRWEPWHYRYVGVKDAKRIEHSGQSLQEFLERAGTTPHC